MLYFDQILYYFFLASPTLTNVHKNEDAALIQMPSNKNRFFLSNLYELVVRYLT